MTENHTGNLNGVIGAFALGALAGIAATLLYAPQSGRETRDLLSSKGRELKDKADELKGMAEDKLHVAQEFIHDNKANVIAAVKAGKNAVKDELHKLKDKTADELESLSQNA